MNAQIGPGLQDHPELERAARAATAVLEEEIGPPAARVTATWDRITDDRGRPLIRLTISDWTGSATAQFAPEDLQPPDRARRRFYRLWGDLLQEAATKQIKALQASVAEAFGG